MGFYRYIRRPDKGMMGVEKDKLYNLAFHCRLKKSVSVKKAHFVISRIEDDIKKKFNNICGISIHVEPR